MAVAVCEVVKTFGAYLADRYLAARAPTGIANTVCHKAAPTIWTVLYFVIDMLLVFVLDCCECIPMMCAVKIIRGPIHAGKL